nr:copia protein [Tanacetum cinerariifolium]
GHPQQALKNKGIVDSGCSRHMTGNKSYLADYQEINYGDIVAFGSSRVNTACYVLNRALVTKSHKKTPYELLNGRTPRLHFMRPFGCLVTILNTLDLLGKFEGKADEDFWLGNQTDKNAGPQDTNGNAGTQDNANESKKEASDAAGALTKEFEQGCMDQRGATKAGSTNSFNIVSNPINAASTSGTFSAGGPSSPHSDVFIPANTLLHVDQNDSQIPNLEDTVELRSTGIFNSAYDDDLDMFTSPVQSMGAEADFNNMESSTIVSPIPTHRVHIDHPKDQILGDPKKKAIRTEWVYRTKKDEKGIVVRNKARLVAQGHSQEKGINYDEVFAPMARIKAIEIFLDFASFMGFIACQMDVKSAFLYDTIEKEVYISQPPSFIDPQFPNKVYKVEKALYGLHQAPRAWYETLSTFCYKIDIEGEQ